MERCGHSERLMIDDEQIVAAVTLVPTVAFAVCAALILLLWSWFFCRRKARSVLPVVEWLLSANLSHEDLIWGGRDDGPKNKDAQTKLNEYSIHFKMPDSHNMRLKKNLF